MHFLSTLKRMLLTQLVAAEKKSSQRKQKGNEAMPLDILNNPATLLRLSPFSVITHDEVSEIIQEMEEKSKEIEQLKCEVTVLKVFCVQKLAPLTSVFATPDEHWRTVFTDASYLCNCQHPLVGFCFLNSKEELFLCCAFRLVVWMMRLNALHCATQEKLADKASEKVDAEHRMLREELEQLRRWVTWQNSRRTWFRTEMSWLF